MVVDIVLRRHHATADVRGSMEQPAASPPWLEQPHQGEFYSYTDREGARRHLAVRYPHVTSFSLVEAEELLPGLFHSAVGLEGFHFCDRIDLYALADGKGGALLIDTGHYDLVDPAVIVRLITAAGARWETTEIFLTHLHDDHAGSVPICLHQGASRVYRGHCEPYSDQAVDRFLNATGSQAVGDTALRAFVAFLLGKDNPLFSPFPALREANEGGRLDVGPFSLEVLDTPGHTAEHRCLLDAARGMLLCGDHLIFGAPGVMQLRPDQHLLRDYLGSMAGLRGRGPKLLLMSHHEPLTSSSAIDDLIGRILKAHERPLAKVAALLDSQGPLTVYEMARAYDADRPQGLDGQSQAVRARRIALMWGYLDYLADTGRAGRHGAGEGTLVYEAL